MRKLAFGLAFVIVVGFAAGLTVLGIASYQGIRLLWGKPRLSQVTTAAPAITTAASLPASQTVASAINRLVVLDDAGNLATIRPDGSDRLALTTDASTEHVYRQPTWSPTAERIAWAEVTLQGRSRAESRLITARPDGSGLTHSDVTAFPPFYIAWAPDGSRLAYLSNWPGGLALRLVDVAAGGSTITTLDQGQPLYFAWAPDGQRLLTHIGTTRLAVLSLGGENAALAAEPGQFGAPQWSRDGARLAFAVREGDSQQLVLANAAGQPERQITSADGNLSFSLSPDSRQIAYVISPSRIATAAFGPLSIADVATGAVREISHRPVVAFFWRPDSHGLLLLRLDDQAAGIQASLRPVQNDGVWFRWYIWDGTELQPLARFVPSPTYLIDYLRFFDQFGQSMTPWAPDGRAFVYPGQGEDRQTGIWVQPMADGRAPRRVTDGVFAAWSPR